MSLQFNQKSNKKKNSGFYTAITLCCAAVCLVAWSTALSNRAGEDFTDNDVQTQQSGQTQRWMTEEEAGGEPASAYEDAGSTTRSTTLAGTVQTSDSAQNLLPPTQPSAAPAAAAAQKITQPIENGKIIKSFSGEDLLYSVTMGDWRVHQGTDIQASDGAKVRAVTGGTVTEVMEDVLYGYTVVVRHADGSMLYYSGLSSVCPVSKDQQISSGDVIGTVGIVPCESADGSHLHLSLMKDGGFSDPVAAFGLK